MTILQSESNFLIENFVNDSLRKREKRKARLRRKLNEQVKNLIINKQQIGERALFGRESTTEITV